MPERSCSIDDCEGAHYGRGWCERHYQRWKKHGDPQVFVRAFEEREKGRTCSVDGCGQKHRCRGYCVMHYQRWQKYGDPLLTTTAAQRKPRRNRTEEEAWASVMARVVKLPSGCWEYQGATGSGGYGRIRWAGRTQSAPRVAYQMLVGSAPGEMNVCHRCDNPPCINPDHLFLGTQADNVRDMVAKGRARGRMSATRVSRG